MSIHDALSARPLEIAFRGEAVRLRRPTVADLVAMIDAESRGPNMAAMYVSAHVIDENGNRVYTYETALNLSAPAVIGLSKEIEKLYGEGLD
jgi:hypothetical protein